MKKIYTISIAALASLLMCSCEKFLTKDTISTLNSETFFENEKSLELYANSFMVNMMPDASSIAQSSDSYTDVCATRTDTQYFTTEWSSSQQTGWSYGNWTNLYRCNYLLVHLGDVKGISEATLKHYEGIARFWRAFFYFYKMRYFGDVPWYDKPIDQSDEEALYKARDSREFITSKILEDLDFAAQYCNANVKTQQADKWKALALKARVCLYEGTYRKYHANNPSTNEPWQNVLGDKSGDSKYLLEECVKACKTIMDEGPFKLNEAVSKTYYRSLFMTEAMNPTEIIWQREYNRSLNLGHQVNWDYWNKNSQGWSMTRAMADMYLKLDGSRYTDSSNYGKDLYPKEVADRDYRMQQTIICPGYMKTVNGVYGLYPTDATGTHTGYQIIKWCYDDDTHMNGYNANCVPIIRYAEILLAYAEASGELAGGVISDEIWDKTIRPLRVRAGVVGTKPAKIDAKLNAYYGGNLTSDMVELRRERAVELFMEDSRWNDLMRWKLGELCVMDKEGIFIPGVDVLMDLNDDGAMDACYGSGENPVEGVAYWNNKTYGLNSNGRLTYDIKRTWHDRKYLHPIPHTANSINPNLGQNYGWDD